MRKFRNITVAFAAVAGFAGFSASQAMATNVYEVNGSGTTGGTPSKPKAAKLKATFTIKSDAGDLIPDVVKTYAISIEGGRLNKKALAVLPKCKPSSETAETQDDKQCSKKSIVGKGTLSAAVGKPGDPINRDGFTCSLPYNLYNVGGGNLGLFIRATTKECPIAVTKWIITKVTQKGRTVTTTFSTPENLQQPAPGLFSPVTEASFSLNPVYVKIKGKKVSTTESIGCTDKKRDVSVKFTTRAGAVSTVKKTLPC